MSHQKPRSPRSPDPPPLPLPTRKEWIAIAAIALLAAALRLAFPDRMAIEHFDEGVYASNIFFSEAEGGQYPYRHLYAPPLLPWLIEWGIIFLGPDSIAPFLPALILGIATVPLMWWVARSWFGLLAGLAAALLVATSDFHILYSRAALTDVPVMFFIVLAVYLYFEAVRRDSIKWSIFAGLATGLAWWTKYTGWLPLAIALAGSAGWVLGDLRSGWPRMRERGIRVGWCWGAMAVTAFVVWSPVLYALQEHGGYAAVAENHAGYLISEPGEFFSNGASLTRKLIRLSGLLTGLVLALIAGTIPLSTPRPQWWEVAGGVLLGCAVLLATAWFGPVMTMGLLALVGLLLEAFWRVRRPIDDRGQRDLPTLPLWLLAAWFAGMTLATPFYTPYPRMAFPWLFAAMLLSCRWLASPDRTRVPREGSSRIIVAGALVLCMIPGVRMALDNVLGYLLDKYALTVVDLPQWQDKAGVKRAAADFTEEIRAELDDDHRPAIVYVVGEPAAFFHLSVMLSDEDAAVIPAGSLQSLRSGGPRVETFALVGLPSRLASRHRIEQKIDRSSQFQTTMTVNTSPSDLVTRDSNSNVLYGPPQLVLLHAEGPPD